MPCGSLEHAALRSGKCHPVPVRGSFPGRYQVHRVGGQDITKCRIPAENIGELNANFVGPIELAAECH